MSALEFHLDFETFSELDLTKVGVHRYAEHESTHILMASYAIGDGPVKLWVPAKGERMPADLEAVLDDDRYTGVAWNAPFERTIIRNQFTNGEHRARPGKWRCAMVEAMAIGLPAKLEHAAPAIGLSEDETKLKEGRRLINKFCKPRKPSKKKAWTRSTHMTDPEDWALFEQYCVRDTESERAITTKLHAWRQPADELQLWRIDQEINDFGIKVDIELVRAAVAMGNYHRELLMEEAKQLTGLANPNSTQQLLDWLNDTPDFNPDDDQEELANLQKKTIEKILGREDLTDVTRRVLELRQQIAKASLKKYDTLIRATCADGRIRGTMQFGGANRTMRWAGRLLQVQNLPQGIIENLKLLSIARELVRAGDYEAVKFIFGNVPDVLATLIRTCLVAEEGSILASADFSAIEAVITAWFADCKWRLQVFRTHGKIYEASASTAFKVPFEEFARYKKENDKHHPLRKKGKVIELACGYQGGTGALVQMGALEMGIEEDELPAMVEAWRDASPEIAGWKNEDGYRENGLWQRVEAAAKKCILTGRRQDLQVGENGNSTLTFRMAGGMMVITLPSGRHMHYQRARVVTKSNGRKQITYMGQDQRTKRYTILETYGGKLVENIVQAFARDCLKAAMLKLHAKGYPMTMLVHDEIVFELLMREIESGRMSLQEILSVMAEPLPFAPGLPLKGAGYINPFYYKD